MYRFRTDNSNDLRQGNQNFRVSTKVKDPSGHFLERMGPDVIVTARDAEHAKEVARQNGHMPNEYFPPERIRK